MLLFVPVHVFKPLHITSHKSPLPSPPQSHHIHPLSGILDGGDVLQVAGHMLVGLTARSNAAAVDQLRALLSAVTGGGGSDAGGSSGPIRVEGVEVPHGLHLKSACSALDSSTILFSDNPAGRAVAAGIRARVPTLSGLEFVFVPDDPLACNVLRIGPHVVMQASPAEGVLRALCAGRGLELHVLPRMGEFVKADGAVTCCSILLS
jgi:dimethylargininase